MHNNYYLLRKVTEELLPIIKGGVISECFSQNKEELIVRIELGTTSFYIKGNMQPSFSCLSFPNVFHRAKKNSVDLFPECIGLRIEGIRQFTNERSFALLLSDNHQLLFKMHGNRSNVVLFHQERVHTLFRHNLEADETIDFNSLDKTIDWSREAFDATNDKLKQHYFTFGKVVWNDLEKKGFFSATIDEQWSQINQLKTSLEHPIYYITHWQKQLVLSLLPVGTILKKSENALQALNDFASEFLQSQAYEQEKTSALHQLTQKISGAQNYITKTSAKLHEVENDQHYRVWADLLMANLHAVKTGSEKIVLPDFYSDNNPVEIKLKPEFSVQKNAEVFYRKSKNQQIEIDRLKKTIEDKQTEVTNLQQQLELIQTTADLRELRKFTQKDTNLQKKKEQENPLPYHEFLFNGYTIWVGRNAQANDVLTLKHTYKEDLWLHAKDVAGSHVVIKHQAGKPFPKDVIERAAQLAAYNSKRKTESLAPVAYTPKKFVRKRKGDPAGMVVVEREEVILVEPKLN